MVLYLLIAGQALCLFSLWVLTRADLVRLMRPARRVQGVVIGYRSMWNDGGKSFAPVFRFASEGAEHEVTDAVHHPSAKPALGTVVSLTHPEGRPDLARPPRLLMWLAVYGVLIGLEAMLLAKMMGWLGG